MLNFSQSVHFMWMILKPRIMNVIMKTSLTDMSIVDCYRNNGLKNSIWETAFIIFVFEPSQTLVQAPYRDKMFSLFSRRK